MLFVLNLMDCGILKQNPTCIHAIGDGLPILSNKKNIDFCFVAMFSFYPPPLMGYMIIYYSGNSVIIRSC